MNLKELFLNTSEKLPFLSTEVFSFFGYTRHSHFRRFLDNPKFYKNLQFNDDCWNIVKDYKRNTVLLDRKIFLYLCRKQKIDTTEFEKWNFEYRTKLIENSTSEFLTIKKGEKHALYMWNRPAGKYYNHSLNTINLARAIDVSPFEIYKFCAEELQWNNDNSGAGIMNEYGRTNAVQYPYYHYDNIQSGMRHEYLAIIKRIIDKYPLPDFNKRLAEFYYEAVKKMLMIQI